MVKLRVVEFLRSILVGREVSLKDVAHATERPRKPILRVMDKLAKDRIVEQVRDEREHLRLGQYGPKRRNPVWRVLKKPDLSHPKSPKRRTVRDRIWKAMRDKKQFTREDLQRTSGAGAASVAKYCLELEKAGIIKVQAVYRLKKTYVLPPKNAVVKRPILNMGDDCAQR